MANVEAVRAQVTWMDKCGRANYSLSMVVDLIDAWRESGFLLRVGKAEQRRITTSDLMEHLGLDSIPSFFREPHIAMLIETVQALARLQLNEKIDLNRAELDVKDLVHIHEVVLPGSLDEQLVGLVFCSRAIGEATIAKTQGKESIRFLDRPIATWWRLQGAAHLLKGLSDARINLKDVYEGIRAWKRGRFQVAAIQEGRVELSALLAAYTDWELSQG